MKIVVDSGWCPRRPIGWHAAKVDRAAPHPHLLGVTVRILAKGFPRQRSVADRVHGGKKEWLAQGNDPSQDGATKPFASHADYRQDVTQSGPSSQELCVRTGRSGGSGPRHSPGGENPLPCG